MLVSKSPLVPPFVKGGELYEITLKYPPFVKGERGGFSNKMKLFLARVISLLPLALILVFLASSAWSTELYIPPVKGKPGEPVDIPIMLDEVDNLAGVKLVLKYDAKILTFKKGAKTKRTDSLMHIVNDKKPGLLIVVMAGARGIKGKAFAIFTLTFEIKKGLKGNHATEIKITEIQLMSDQLKDIETKTRIHPITILP